MAYLLLFVLEIVLIFFLSKRIHLELSRNLMKITRNKNLSVYILSFLFLPGTFVHEMAHFITALLLLVPVGNLHLIPQIEDDGIRLGSVSIAKTDPIRRFFIGTAPFFIGVFLIVLVPYLLFNGNLAGNFWIYALTGYGIFTISNSMFSSKRDMEGLWGFLFIVLFFLVGLWFIGIRIDLSAFFIKTNDIFKTTSLFLTLPILIDIVALSLVGKPNKRA